MGNRCTRGRDKHTQVQTISQSDTGADTQALTAVKAKRRDRSTHNPLTGASRHKWRGNKIMCDRKLNPRQGKIKTGHNRKS